MFIFVCTVFLLLFIAYIAIKLKEEDRERKARYTSLRQEKEENLKREDELFSRILKEENVPTFYLKIGLLGDYRCPPTRIPSDEITPALLWKDGAQFFLLPIGPGYLRMQLNGKEATQITVWCEDYWDKTGLIPPTEDIEYYRGPFAKYFRETAQRRKVEMDRNHPEFIRRFSVPNETITSLRRSGEYRNMEDYYKKMQMAGCKPKPILHYYGEYSFGGYYISKPSAKLIHEKYGVRFVAEGSSMPINGWNLGHPRISKEEIDVYKALLNDGMITQEEYEKRKEKYLQMRFRRSQKGDTSRLHTLTEYLQLDLITRSEANYWLEYEPDSNISMSTKEKQETKGEDRQESPEKDAMRLVDEERNLNDATSMAGLERWEVDALSTQKEDEERQQIEHRREQKEKEKRAAWQQQREKSILKRRQDVQERRARLAAENEPGQNAELMTQTAEENSKTGGSELPKESEHKNYIYIEQRRTYAIQLIDEGKNLDEVASMADLKRWEVDVLFNEKVREERCRIERRREQVKKEEEIAWQQKREESILKRRQDVQERRARLARE